MIACLLIFALANTMVASAVFQQTYYYRRYQSVYYGVTGVQGWLEIFDINMAGGSGVFQTCIIVYDYISTYVEVGIDYDTYSNSATLYVTACEDGYAETLFSGSWATDTPVKLGIFKDSEYVWSVWLMPYWYPMWFKLAEAEFEDNWYSSSIFTTFYEASNDFSTGQQYTPAVWWNDLQVEYGGNWVTSQYTGASINLPSNTAVENFDGTEYCVYAAN